MFNVVEFLGALVLVVLVVLAVPAILDSRRRKQASRP